MYLILNKGNINIWTMIWVNNKISYFTFFQYLQFKVIIYFFPNQTQKNKGCVDLIKPDNL